MTPSSAAGKQGISPAVSVIIVNWNSGPWLGRALAGLARQTIDAFETIVVDNASTDNSIAQAMPYLPQARLLAQATNLGFAAGNNLAAKVAAGQWLALLNPDAIPETDWLERLLAAAALHPDFTVFGSRQLIAGQPGLLDGVGDAYHVSGLAWRMGHGEDTAAAPAQPVEIFSPCAAAALYRRDQFLSAGGFDERYFCYLEDVDLGFRLRLRGARALYVPDATVHHAGSASAGRHSDFSIYHSQRNLVWTFLKNMPAALLLPYLPAHLALNFFAVAYFAYKGQGRVIAKAKWDALLGLPEILRERRSLQAGRTVRATGLLRQMARGWPRRHGLPAANGCASG
jgi:GT2 family glycosyltransferase